MPALAAISFEHPALLIPALAMVALTLLAARLRRLSWDRATLGFIVAGLTFIALAAGAASIRTPDPTEIPVLIDLSASTRTATYRDAVTLRRRIAGLLGDRPWRPYAFAGPGTLRPLDLPEQGTLGDLPGDSTAFEPPTNAPAALVFTDAQFAVPALSPPIFIVVDPALDAPPDVQAIRLDFISAANQVTAQFSNRTGGGPAVAARVGQTPATLPAGTSVVRAAATPSQRFTAEVDKADPWPENNALSLTTPPQQTGQRWWVSQNSAAPAGFLRMAPGQLPAEDLGDYLQVAVLVLDNIPASAIPEAAQHRLSGYVRDLGGAVVLIGGDRAFAAGAYSQTPLDDLSPLASSPPGPALRWVIVADASGSMAAGNAGATRWDRASGAIRQALSRVPADDPVWLGTFADTLAWHVRDRAPREVLATLASLAIQPHGPTNLRPAVAQAIAALKADMPAQVLLITDADADFPDPAPLRDSLRAANARFSVLAIGTGRAMDALRALAADTSGQVVQEPDPARWADAAQRLVRMATPPRLDRTPTVVHFSGDLAPLPARPLALHNITFARAGATPLASADVARTQRTLAAAWNLGTGRVAAMAFAATPAEASALADRVAVAPADPRFSVRVTPGSRVRITVDAADLEHRPLNAQRLALRLDAQQSAVTSPIPQSAPGRYELELPAPRQPAIATVSLDGLPLTRLSIAGRYAPEFDAIGNDAAAMSALADATGGRVILPTQTGRIELPAPSHSRSLSPWLALLGALLVAVGIWRGR